MNKTNNNKRTAAFFDLDNTLLNINSSVKLGFYMLKRRAVTLRMFAFLFATGILYQVYLYKPENILLRHLKMLKDQPLSQYRKVADEIFSNPEIYFRESMIEKYKDHKKKGHFTVIITQNYDLIAEYFTKTLKPDALISTVPEIKDGKFTGKALKLCVSHNKSTHVLEIAKKYNLDLNNSYAYTDSIHDIKMLNLVGNVYIVNRNPLLKWVGQRKGWEIINS